MKAKKNWLAIVLSLCLLVSSILVVASATGDAAMSTEATSGGIQVSLTTSKDTYAEKEAIKVILAVGNSTGVDVANVKTSVTVPEVLTLAKGSPDMTYEKLGAAQLLQNKLFVSLGELEVAPEDDPDWGSEDDPDTNADSGDDSDTNVILIVAIVVLVASAGGLAYLLITGKIRFNKTACLLLLVGVMLFSLIPNVSAEETDEKKLEVAKVITVNGQEVTLTATVTWEDAKAPDTITRADMEAAVTEIFWDYYMKDVWMQYDSMSFNNSVTYFHGGFSRLDTHLSTLENANSHDTLFSVCSNYPWVAYYETLGFPMFGYCMNAQSANVWGYAGTTVKNEHVNDMVVVRYHGISSAPFVNDGEGFIRNPDGTCSGTIEPGREDGYLYHDKCLGSYEDLVAYFRNWKENLRPGDIIHLPGHIVVYAGNGYILECSGRKYNLDYSYDELEYEGAISAKTVEEYFFPSGTQTSAYPLSKYETSESGRIAVVRPLDILTIDDGDGDPSNDVLDADFVYNGVDKLNWQFEFDKVPLAHSGYTIQPSAYTRMQYPCMNIDRTVNITPYGTATKGEEITYTVAIYNESNNARFVDNKIKSGDKDYAGVDYKGLSITETLPDNVELVSAEGATIMGDKMYWTVDVPAGECVKVSYTVKVTGKIGDEIVCGGGWVGAIPSNTIVNTIGGKKLSEESVANLIEFYEVGKDVWNSNQDGYKISAALESTEFAERIYNATTGLDLDLPDAQTLLDILFTQTHISVPGGMYGMNASPAEGWLYTLNDTTADPNNQIWRDMIVNGYFGGTWVWSNNFDPEVRRTDDPRIDYLEVGDIIVSMSLSARDENAGGYRTVTGWQVMVYLGDEYFASLNSEGRMTCMQGPRNTLPLLVSDVFVALRPSQVYENINQDVPGFTGTVADLTDADKAWQNNSEPSDVLLNDELCAKLAALVPSGYSDTATSDIIYSGSTGPEMIGNVYKKIGVEVITNGTWGMKAKALMHSLFYDVPSDSEVYKTFGHHNYLLEEPEKGYEGIYNMLMYYDGRAFADKKPLASLDDLHVGDAIILVQRDANISLTMIYQGVNENGNHQFLTGMYSATGKLNYGSSRELYEFSSTESFMDFADERIFGKGGGGYTDFYWEGYIVLRPSRAYPDINDREIRDITTRPMSDGEKNLLASVTPEDLIGTSGAINLDGFAKAVYSHAYLEIDKYINKTVVKARQDFMGKNGLYDPRVKPEAEPWLPMVVENSWGGTMMSDTSKHKLSLKITDFQIGDIFCIRNGADTSNYIVAI